MENLKMHTPDLAQENFKKLASLFPNAVTETITGYDEKGNAIIERAIDADVLRQEISAQVVGGYRRDISLHGLTRRNLLFWRTSLSQRRFVLTVKNRSDMMVRPAA